MIALIGGSGIYKIDGVSIVKEVNVETPFGLPSGNIKILELGGVEFLFLARHGEGHTISPSQINYRANIFALKKMGAREIISVSAVGSLKDEYAPGTIVLPDQFIDWTKGKRERTFFSDGVVCHVSVADPIERQLLNRLAEVCDKVGVKSFKGGAYICIEGPQFSSKAESCLYRSFGADIIGMTNVPESYLAKEAGIAYASIAMVTDYDCWKDHNCTVEEILKVVHDNNKSAHKIILELIPSLTKNPISYLKDDLLKSVMTDVAKISSEQKQILEILAK